MRRFNFNMKTMSTVHLHKTVKKNNKKVVRHLYTLKVMLRIVG